MIRRPTNIIGGAPRKPRASGDDPRLVMFVIADSA